MQLGELTQSQLTYRDLLYNRTTRDASAQGVRVTRIRAEPCAHFALGLC